MNLWLSESSAKHRIPTLRTSRTPRVYAMRSSSPSPTTIPCSSSNLATLSSAVNLSYGSRSSFRTIFTVVLLLTRQVVYKSRNSSLTLFQPPSLNVLTLMTSLLRSKPSCKPTYRSSWLSCSRRSYSNRRLSATKFAELTVSHCHLS